MKYVIVDGATEKPIDPQIGYVDGYSFADTLLEGVMFAIVVEDGELVCKGPNADYNEYMKKFVPEQIEKWNKQALETAIEMKELHSVDGKTDLFIDEAS